VEVGGGEVSVDETVSPQALEEVDELLELKVAITGLVKC